MTIPLCMYVWLLVVWSFSNSCSPTLNVNRSELLLDEYNKLCDTALKKCCGTTAGQLRHPVLVKLRHLTREIRVNTFHDLSLLLHCSVWEGEGAIILLKKTDFSEDPPYSCLWLTGFVRCICNAGLKLLTCAVALVIFVFELCLSCSNTLHTDRTIYSVAPVWFLWF